MPFSFLQKGAASAALAKKNAVEQEARKAEQGKMFRFWLKDGEEARITFIDGDLSPDGVLLPDRCYEHNVFLNGQWNNFFYCPKMTHVELKDFCPICEGGDRPALVSFFTILDHRIIKSKDGTKTYKDSKRLLVAKPPTMEMLNKHAVKRGGLAGVTFDVSRTGQKTASVGSMFDFVEKRDIAELKKLYTIETVDPKTNLKIKKTNFTPADYEKEITFRTGEELRKLGFGGPSVGGDPTAGNSGESAPVDYSKEL